MSAEHSPATAIGPRTLLTHNHFNPATGTLPQEFILLSGPTGNSFQQAAAEVARQTVNPGTQVWRVTYDLGLPPAPMADAAALRRLAPGRALTVMHWAEASQRIVPRDFTILAVAERVVTLNDPDSVIILGDSGGGIYFEDKLVGNTWSINGDQSGRPLGSFNAALLAPEVTDAAR